MKTLQILAVLVVGCLAVVRLPITSPGGRMNSRMWIDGIEKYFSIGIHSTNRGLQFYDDAIKSGTFKKLRETRSQNGYLTSIQGTDTCVIAYNDKNQTLVNKPLTLDRMSYSWTGMLSMGRSKEGKPTFVEDILAKEKEKVAVLNFDKTWESRYFTGTLTLGQKPSICSKKWTTVPAVEYKLNPKRDWAFQVNSLKVGKLEIKSPAQAVISENYNGFYLPNDVYLAITKELGANFVNGEGILTADPVDCSKLKDIVFNVGGLDLTLKPEEYIYKMDDNYCQFSGMRFDKFDNMGRGQGEMRYDNNSLVLPLYVFRDRCIMLDYAKKQVGFADKVKAKNEKKKGPGSVSRSRRF